MKLLGGAFATCLALFCLLVMMVGSANAATSSSLTVSPTAGIVGNKISISGQGYPPNTNLVVEWSTVGHELGGCWKPSPSHRAQRDLHRELARFGGDEFLRFLLCKYDHPFRLWGSAHSASRDLQRNRTPREGCLHARALIPYLSHEWARRNRDEVTATGLAYTSYSTSYHLFWDNSYVGYFTAISSRGATNFTFYASGNPGTHYVQIYQGYPGPAYLNPQQGPPSSETQSVFPPYIPFKAVFDITTGQSAESPSLIGSTSVASLIVSAAALAALMAGGLFVTKSNPRDAKQLRSL